MVDVYSAGIICCSVCTDEEPEAMVEKVNQVFPAGETLRWRISEDPCFANGQPNPCVCDQNPNLKHYLLEC